MFTFVHTSDWHIGKSFSGFGDKAGELQSARLTAIDRIAAAATAHGARHVLVGGDTFHTPSLDLTLARQPVARMRAHAGLSWHLIPGNHDPGSADLWRRLAAEGLPANVVVHQEPQPVELATGVVLLPCPLATKFASADPTAHLSSIATPPGSLRIALAHGAVATFGNEGRGAIATDRAEQASLSYLALGDWHGCKQIGPRTWYAGTPEPDSYPDNEPGFALVVGLDGPAAAPRVTTVATAQFTWRRTAMTVSSAADLADLERDIDRAGPAAARWLLQLSLSGHLSLADIAALDDHLERVIAPRLFHLERNDDDLHAAAAPADIETLPSEDLQWVARQLVARTDSGTPAEAAIATRALRQLLNLTSEAAADGAAR